MRYKPLSIENIPGGLNFFEKMCQSSKMEDDIEIQAKEIYERILLKINEALDKSILSQTEIGDRCGLSQPAINRIKNRVRGKDLPFLSILKLALVLNIDLTTLYLSTNPAQEKLKTLISEINKMIVNE